MSATMGRRVGLLEGAVQRELRRRFSAAIVRLRETMRPEHARFAASWMHAHGFGSEPGGRSENPSHPCTPQPNHACGDCIDRLDPPALVRAMWVQVFQFVRHGTPVAMPAEIAQVYVDRRDVVPGRACEGCGYLLPARGGRLAYTGACPICSCLVTAED